MPRVWNVSLLIIFECIPCYSYDSWCRESCLFCSVPFLQETLLAFGCVLSCCSSFPSTKKQTNKWNKTKIKSRYYPWSPTSKFLSTQLVIYDHDSDIAPGNKDSFSQQTFPIIVTFLEIGSSKVYLLYGMWYCTVLIPNYVSLGSCKAVILHACILSSKITKRKLADELATALSVCTKKAWHTMWER